MDSHAEIIEGKDGSRLELGTIVHEGKEYTNQGSYVSDDLAVGYYKSVDSLSGVITTWHGDELGKARIVASWTMNNCWISSRQYQVEAVINGKLYTGRTMGDGMVWHGKLKKS